MTIKEQEVVQLFRERAQPLSVKLTEMLNEHYSHQTERRGCGYTQATRVLADYINTPRDCNTFYDLKIFDDFSVKRQHALGELKHLHNLADWHNLDIQPPLQHFVQNTPNELSHLQNEIKFQQQLRQISQYAELEESKLICDLIEDIILPKDTQQTGLTELKSLVERPKVGSCPMAENFFLKIAHRRVLRSGEINIFVDEQNEPLLMEKLNMGDNHSCISLKPILMNGIRVPQGSLFSVDYSSEHIENKTPNKEFKGFILPYSAINGFWFLRLTTLAVSPKNRKRAFSTHFDQQVTNGLYSPETTQIQQLLDVALTQFR